MENTKKTKKNQQNTPTSESHANKKVMPSTRGREFEGKVTKKFSTRVVIEFERTEYVPKYERFYKKKSRLHARLPQDMSVEVGDLVSVRECRPLSKILHFIVVDKIKSLEVKK